MSIISWSLFLYTITYTNTSQASIELYIDFFWWKHNFHTTSLASILREYGKANFSETRPAASHIHVSLDPMSFRPLAVLDWNTIHQARIWRCNSKRMDMMVLWLCQEHRDGASFRSRGHSTSYTGPQGHSTGDALHRHTPRTSWTLAAASDMVRWRRNCLRWVRLRGAVLVGNRREKTIRYS
jgi:hypothetical protein